MRNCSGRLAVLVQVGDFLFLQRPMRFGTKCRIFIYPGFPGVVTRFHLLTRPLLSMYQSLYIYPISEYKKVLQWEIDVGAAS